MSRLELFSPEGLRIDGRRFNELRNFNCSTNTHPQSSDGSSYVQQGNTKLICLIRGPSDTLLPTSSNNTTFSNTEPTLNISINYPPFASLDRKKRSKNDRRISELCIILKRCFMKTIILKNYPHTLIDINITILSLDGGLLSACCNSITLALIDAGIAMYDYISAISIGLYDQCTLLDLNSLEETDLSFVTIGVVGNSDKINLMLCEDKIPLDKLERLISLGIEGCHRIKELMDEKVRQVGSDLLTKKQ